MRLARRCVALGSFALVAGVAPTAAQTAQSVPDAHAVAATAAIARAARAALVDPASPAPWAEMRMRLRNERLRKGIAVPDAAERIAGTIADSLAPAITGIRIDPAERRAEMSIAAEGASFRVGPPVVESGRVRVFIDVLNARSAFAVKSFPWLRDGGVLAMALDEDADGTRITLDLRPRAHFRAIVGNGGLLLRIEAPGYHVRPWSVAAPGAPEPPRVQVGPAQSTTAAMESVGAPVTDGAAAVESSSALPMSVASAAADTTVAAAIAPAGATTRRSGSNDPARHQPPRTTPPVDGGLGGPLTPPQMMLLLALVLLPPMLALRYASRRRAGGAATPTAAAPTQDTMPLTPESPEHTVDAEPGTDSALIPAPVARRRRTGLLGWRRRTADPAPNADSRLWVARTLASNGAPPVDVARRLRLSRDAVMLLGRADRARQD